MLVCRVLVILGLITVGGTASAGEVAAEERERQAEQAMARGVKARARGALDEALAAFARAQQLVPEANLPYRFAAEVLESLGRWSEAVDSYRTYLRIKPGVSDAARVEARIAELRAQHLDGVVDVSCRPTGAQLFLDGGAAPIGATPLQGFVVPAGAHTLRVAAEGFREAQLDASVIAGSRLVLHCALEPLVAHAPATVIPLAPAAPASVTAPSRPALAHRRPWYRHWALWTGVGAAAGVALAVGLGVGLGMPQLPATDGGTHHFPQ